MTATAATEGAARDRCNGPGGVAQQEGEFLMSVPNATGDINAKVAKILAAHADLLVDVLDVGDLDDESRERLSRSYRIMCQQVAILTPSVAIEPKPVKEPVDEDRARFDATWNHVGAIWALRRELVGGRYGGGVYLAQLLVDVDKPWIDDLDATTDRELLALPGFGRKALGSLRAALALYYWRGDPDESRALWQSILDDFENNFEMNRYLKERVRVADGITFARLVLEHDGAPLADPTSPRWAVKS